MDEVLMLSRIQFAVTVFYHFLFVPLTIGLVILVAIMETKYARTLDLTYKRMADYWGRLFAINFVLGVITGITMEFQFARTGLNTRSIWAIFLVRRLRLKRSSLFSWSRRSWGSGYSVRTSSLRKCGHSRSGWWRSERTFPRFGSLPQMDSCKTPSAMS